MSALPRIISKEALSDLEEIWLYTVEKWSLDEADRYYKMIFEEINFICRKPYFGNKMDHIRDGYLASKVKSHLIFYKIENETIKIIRILHERMDIENRLNG